MIAKADDGNACCALTSILVRGPPMADRRRGALQTSATKELYRNQPVEAICRKQFEKLRTHIKAGGQPARNAQLFWPPTDDRCETLGIDAACTRSRRHVVYAFLSIEHTPQQCPGWICLNLHTGARAEHKTRRGV